MLLLQIVVTQTPLLVWYDAVSFSYSIRLFCTNWILFVRCEMWDVRDIFAHNANHVSLSNTQVYISYLTSLILSRRWRPSTIKFLTWDMEKFLSYGEITKSFHSVHCVVDAALMTKFCHYCRLRHDECSFDSEKLFKLCCGLRILLFLRMAHRAERRST